MVYEPLASVVATILIRSSAHSANCTTAPGTPACVRKSRTCPRMEMLNQAGAAERGAGDDGAVTICRSPPQAAKASTIMTNVLTTQPPVTTTRPDTSEMAAVREPANPLAQGAGLR